MVQAGEISEDDAWDPLAHAYEGYSVLQHRFGVLHTGTDRDALEIYRAG
jgi:hypothetical protein